MKLGADCKYSQMTLVLTSCLAFNQEELLNNFKGFKIKVFK